MGCSSRWKKMPFAVGISPRVRLCKKGTFRSLGAVLLNLLKRSALAEDAMPSIFPVNYHTTSKKKASTGDAVIPKEDMQLMPADHLASDEWMGKRLLESTRRRRGSKEGEKRREITGGTGGPGLPWRKDKLAPGYRAAGLRTLLWTVDGTAI